MARHLSRLRIELSILMLGAATAFVGTLAASRRRVAVAGDLAASSQVDTRLHFTYTTGVMTRPFALLAGLGLLLGACAATTDHDQPVAKTAAASPAGLTTPSRGTASPFTVRPPATPGPSAITDAVAWAQIRTAMPAGASVGAPIWLPPSVDRARVDLQGIVSGPDDPRFVLTYYGTKGAIAYALGPIDEVGGSGYGTIVRGVRATLTFATSLFSDSNTPAPRRVRWQEGARTFSLSSDTYSGDDSTRAPNDPRSNADVRICERVAARSLGGPLMAIRNWPEWTSAGQSPSTGSKSALERSRHFLSPGPRTSFGSPVAKYLSIPDRPTRSIS